MTTRGFVRQRGSVKTILIILCMVVVVCLVGAAIWQLFLQPTSPSSTAQSAGKNNSVKYGTDAPAGWKSYESSKYHVSFIIPNDWSVEERDKQSNRTIAGELYEIVINMPNKSKYTDAKISVYRGKVKTFTDSVLRSYGAKKSYTVKIVPMTWNGYEAQQVTTYLDVKGVAQVGGSTLYVQVGSLVYIVPDTTRPPIDVQDGKVDYGDWLKYAESVRVNS